jgi:hypothetical protein
MRIKFVDIHFGRRRGVATEGHRGCTSSSMRGKLARVASTQLRKRGERQEARKRTTRPRGGN